MDQSFGEILASIRKEVGVSQAKLADAADVSIPTVRLAEKTLGTIKSFFKLVACVNHSARLSRTTNVAEFGSVLAVARKRRCLTQRDAAVASGLSLPTIVNLEKRFTGRMENLCLYLNLLGLRLRLVAKPRPQTAEKPVQRRLAPKTNSVAQDVVMTPPALAQAIVDYFQPSGVVLDPCRGDGAFFNAFPNTVQSEWCEINEGRDFMDFDGGVDWIITNPPWSRLRQFLIKAMSTADNIVFLSAFIHYGTKARMADLRRHGYGWRSFVMVPEPGLNWPQSGFQLGAIHLQRGWEGPCQFIDRIEDWKSAVET